MVVDLTVYPSPWHTGRDHDTGVTRSLLALQIDPSKHEVLAGLPRAELSRAQLCVADSLMCRKHQHYCWVGVGGLR
jgi:hypothetical protein